MSNHSNLIPAAGAVPTICRFPVGLANFVVPDL